MEDIKEDMEKQVEEETKKIEKGGYPESSKAERWSANN